MPPEIEDDIFFQAISEKVGRNEALSYIEVELLRQRRAISDLADSLKDDVHAIRKNTEGLVELWNTGSGVIKVMKWLTIIVAFVSGLWGLFVLFKGGTPPPDIPQ